jgi:L-serine/L-threonine ammonia-lyase
MSAESGRSIWLKLDALQPTGSFKIRGLGRACEQHASRGARRFISSSGGNAGIAVAYAGRALGIPVSVVVPETTSERAKLLIRREGAELIVHGSSWKEANEMAQTMVSDTDAFLHPFDDPLVWQGNATLVVEVANSPLQPDAVVVSVGGGGLLCGIVEGLCLAGWTNVPIITAETEGSASFAQSVKAGRRITLEKMTSVATSLGAKEVCEEAFRAAQTHPIRCATVSDRVAVSACVRFLDDHRMLVEPACGAALALAYENAPELAGLEKVLVVVCGGATTTWEQLLTWSVSFGTTPKS